MDYLKSILALCLIVLMGGCGSDNEPIQQDTLSSIDVTYTYTVSEDMLDYFNISANYVNAKDENVGKHMTSPTITITTSASRFPAKRPLWFTVTRTDVETPAETPHWAATLRIEVTKHYTPSGKSETSERVTSNSYSPLPNKFNEWASTFINNMAQQHVVSVKADGTIEF